MGWYSVIVNKENPVNELSIEQIAKIFTGEITNWSEVGGDNVEILVTIRNKSSGTYEVFREKVVRLDGELKDNEYTYNALTLTTNSAIWEEISLNENAIGYIGLGYLYPYFCLGQVGCAIYDDTVRAISVIGNDSIKGVDPSIESVKDRSSPISRSLYVYVSETVLTDLQLAFLNFIMGDEGQDIVHNIDGFEPGFAPIN